MLTDEILAADAASVVAELADATLVWSPADGSAALSAPVLHDAVSADAVGIISATHTVRYATVALPGLAEGEIVMLGVESYRVAEVRRIGDGRTSIAALHKFATAT